MRKPVTKIGREPVWGKDGPILGADGKIRWKEMPVKEFQFVAFFCGAHKKEQADRTDNEGMRFEFVGCVPVVETL
jgi:hypothetical protein